MNQQQLKVPWWIEDSPEANLFRDIFKVEDQKMIEAPANPRSGTTQREYNMDLEKIFLGRLYAAHQPSEEFPASYKSISEAMGVPENVVGSVIQLLEKRNLLTRRFTWIGGATGGKKAYWTLMTPYEHAMSILEKTQAEIRNGAHRRDAIEGRTQPKKRVNTNSVSTTEISGNAIQQGRAWVDRARTYMKGSDLIQRNLADLKKMGIEVDEEAYLKSVSIQQDDRLAAIALVIPYVDHLLAKRNK